MKWHHTRDQNQFSSFVFIFLSSSLPPPSGSFYVVFILSSELGLKQRKKVVHTHLTWSHNTLTQAGESEVREKVGRGHRKTLQGLWRTVGEQGGKFHNGEMLEEFFINCLFFIFSWTSLALSPEHLLQLWGKIRTKKLFHHSDATLNTATWENV